MPRPPRFDAPFRVALLSGVLFVGAFGCLGLAAAAQTAARSDDAVVAARR
jgi:hypothetical protein